MDTGQLRRVAQCLRQALQHRAPAGAAGDDGKTAVAGGVDKRGFGQAGDGHRTALAQGQQAGVAKAADQHCVGCVFCFCQRSRPSVKGGVGGHGVAGFVGDVGRTKAGGDGAHLYMQTGSGLHMGLQQRADRCRCVGVDDQELAHGSGCCAKQARQIGRGVGRYVELQLGLQPGQVVAHAAGGLGRVAQADGV